MINALTFAAIIIAAEAWIVWLAYCCGHSNGWLEGMEKRRQK